MGNVIDYLIDIRRDLKRIGKVVCASRRDIAEQRPVFLRYLHHAPYNLVGGTVTAGADDNIVLRSVLGGYLGCRTPSGRSQRSTDIAAFGHAFDDLRHQPQRTLFSGYRVKNQ